MNKNKKTIFLVVLQGFGARYLLRSDIFKNLKDAGARLVILTSNADEDYFIEEFKDDNVFIEKFESEKCLEYYSKSKLQKLFKILRWVTTNGASDIKTVEDHYKVFKQESKFMKGPWGSINEKILDSVVWVLRHSSILRKLIIRIESRMFPGNFHNHLFEKYKPSTVITTTLGNIEPGYDAYIMREAKKHNAKVITLILSWDNPSSKGLGGAIPDRIITWTDTMKKEMVEYHDMRPDRIFTGGVAHFDIYYRDDQIMSRDELFDMFGFDKNRKLIFLGTKSPNTYPWNPELVEILGRAIEDNLFDFPCQLLTRLHPIHFKYKKGAPLYSKILAKYEHAKEKYPHVFYSIPRILSKKLYFDMPRDEMVILASILKHSDVLVNMFSTLSIEAAIFQLPVINVCFEGHGNGGRTKAMQNIFIDYNQVHNQRIIKTGGVRTAFSKEELIKYINMYLKNRNLDKENREQIIQNECGPFPGRAGERIADYIIQL